MICKRPSESRKHDIFWESKLAPGEKYLEIQNCVNSGPNNNNSGNNSNL